MSKNYEVYFTNPDSPMFLEQWLENLLQDNRELVTFSEGYWIFRIVEPSSSDVSVTQDVLTDIKTGQSVEKETCSWIQEDDPEICYWKTGCGNSFYFTEGAPTDNRMKYCCYCGRLLKQEE